MNTYKRHRFPPDIISYAVWLYYRLNLSQRDIEDLLAERGIIVSREAIRLWCIKFVAIYTRRLRRKHRGYGDTFYIDEVFVRINRKQHYLWRAVDQDGEVVDVYLQARRNSRYFSVCQQPDRAISRGYPCQGARHETVQVSRSGSAISGCTCFGTQFVQCWEAPCWCAALSDSQDECV